MKQDRRLNGWILIASIIEIFASLILIASGAAVAVLGFLSKSTLAKIDDLQLFISQKLFTQFNLKLEFLYLFIGIAVGVVGLLLLIFAIISMVSAKKRRVVRRKGRIFVFSLLDLVIAGLAGAYLILGIKDLTKSLLSFKEMTDIIKYVMYGLIGVFGFIWLCKMLGIIFGRSEKFMSNDNSKFAFANKARARQEGATPPVQRPAPQGQYAQIPQQPTPQSSQQRVPQGMPNQQNMQRPMQAGQPNVQNMQRPAGMPSRPQVAQPRPQNMQAPQRPAQAQMGQRPQAMQARPSQPTARPVQSGNAGARKFCPKCGKMLSPQEHVCTVCGYKVDN